MRDLFVELSVGAPATTTAVVRQLGDDPAQLVYVVASNMQLGNDERLRILDMDPLARKLRHVLELLQHERTVRELGRSIDEKSARR